MSEPTDRHREIATKIVVKYIDRGANKEIVGYVAAWLATVCAEERERFRAALGALESFAKRADFFDGRLKANGGKWQDDDGYVDDPPSDIYLGHLRAARDALAKIRGGEP